MEAEVDAEEEGGQPRAAGRSWGGLCPRALGGEPGPAPSMSSFRPPEL